MNERVLHEALHEALIEAIQNGSEAEWVSTQLAEARAEGYAAGWNDRHAEVDYGTSLASDR